MKKLFLATASVVALAGSAMAADMPVYKAAPVVAAPACAQFGGFYVGGNVGWKYYEHKWQDKDNFFAASSTAPDTANDFSFANGSGSDNGWTAGAQAGYNWQIGCTVWGVQADWNWTNAKADETWTFNSTLPQLYGPWTVSSSSKEKWYATLRTRSGIVVNNLMLYVTGGFAWAKFDRTFVNNWGSLNYYDITSVDTFSSSKTKLGFVVGAGTEWAWSQNWSITSEFLYMGFEKDTPSFSCNADTSYYCAAYPGNAPHRFEFKDSEWVARIGVNYRFSGAAPVVARY